MTTADDPNFSSQMVMVWTKERVMEYIYSQVPSDMLSGLTLSKSETGKRWELRDNKNKLRFYLSNSMTVYIHRS